MSARTPDGGMTEERLVLAFDECLARIEVGATAESTLARWPDLQAELAPLIRHALEVGTLFAQVAPPPEVAAGIERRIDEETGRSPARRDRRDRPLEGSLARRIGGRVAAWPALALAAIALLFVLAGGIAMARASAPGDLLYPLKRGGQRLLDAITLSDGSEPGSTAGSERSSAPTGIAHSSNAGDTGAAGGVSTALDLATSTPRSSAGGGLDRGSLTPPFTSPSPTTPAAPLGALASGSGTPDTPAVGPATPFASLSPVPSATPSPTPTSTPTEAPPSPGRDRPTKPPPTATDTPHPTVTPSATATSSPTPSATPTPTPHPPTGRIIGRVEYRDSEAPVVGIEVVARRIESDPDVPPFELGETRATETKAEGHFELEGLPVGFWVVGSGDPRLWWEASEDAETADPIEVIAGGVREGIRIRIRGPITDEFAGAPPDR